MKPVLVIMAAGMGSRYGGKKQIDPIDQQGNVIVDYSIYDALQAGFEKVIFIIKEEDQMAFDQAIGIRIRAFIEVVYVYQDIQQLPQGYRLPEGRQKPWGTGHAILALKGRIKAPFAVINADDFYGRKSFDLLFNFLKGIDMTSSTYMMVGYRLENTVTDYGSVSRGICKVKSNGCLSNVVEETHIEKGLHNKIVAINTTTGEAKELEPDRLVSMNMWGFSPLILSELERRFIPFLDNVIATNPLKGEYYLPVVVDDLITAGQATVKVVACDERWYGVTYAEDKEQVVEALSTLRANGSYPKKLWPMN